jgi:hypothetical protein
MTYLMALLVYLSLLFHVSLLPVRVVKHSVITPAISYDVYMPAGKPGGVPRVLMVVHGMTAAAKNEPELVRFAEVMARANFVVFVPEIKGIKRFQLGYDEVAEMSQAIRTMTGLFPEKRKAIMSFCYSNGVAARALEDFPDTTVDTVVFWGSYASLRDMSCYSLTGCYRAGNREIRVPPVAQVSIPFMMQKYWIDYFPRDRQEVLRKALEQKGRLRILTADERNNSAFPAEARHAGFLIDASMPPRLSKTEYTVYRFLKNQDPGKFSAYYNELPPQCRSWIEDMSVEKHVPHLHCNVLFIHSFYDSLIPYNETVRLYDLCKTSRKKMFIPAVFEHFEVIGVGGFIRSNLLASVRGALLYYQFIVSLLRI